MNNNTKIVEQMKKAIFFKKFFMFFIVLIIAILVVLMIVYEAKIIRFIQLNNEEQFVSIVRSALANAATEIERSEIISYMSTSSVVYSKDSVALSKKLMMDLLQNIKQPQDNSKISIYKGGDVNLSNNRTIFVIQLIANLTQRKIPINARIKPEKVKKILDSIFAKYEIKEHYEFAILDSSGNNTIYQTNSFTFKVRKTKKTEFFYQPLFENDYIRAPKYSLVLYFPDESAIRYENINKLMTPVVVLSFIMIIMFILSVYALFKQKRLNEIKNRFIHNMTHELKTPIATIRLSSEMIKDPNIKVSMDMARNLANTIFSEAKRLQFLVEKILQIAMLEKGMAIINRDFYDAHKIIEHAVKSFEIHVKKVGGKLITNFNAKDTIILVDRDHFNNVVQNLLDNAVKYRDKRKKLEIRVETYNEDNQFVLKISDNGIGISREHLKHIFDEFYRGKDTDIHDVKGFGLGLSYVKRMIDEFSGNIEVYSELNKGTSFVIKLPCVDEKDKAEA